MGKFYQLSIAKTIDGHQRWTMNIEHDQDERDRWVDNGMGWKCLTVFGKNEFPSFHFIPTQQNGNETEWNRTEDKLTIQLYSIYELYEMTICHTLFYLLSLDTISYQRNIWHPNSYWLSFDRITPNHLYEQQQSSNQNKTN